MTESIDPNKSSSTDPCAETEDPPSFDHSHNMKQTEIRLLDTDHCSADLVIQESQSDGDGVNSISFGHSGQIQTVEGLKTAVYQVYEAMYENPTSLPPQMFEDIIGDIFREDQDQLEIALFEAATQGTDDRHKNWSMLSRPEIIKSILPDHYHDYNQGNSTKSQGKANSAITNGPDLQSNETQDIGTDQLQEGQPSNQGPIDRAAQKQEQSRLIDQWESRLEAYDGPDRARLLHEFGRPSPQTPDEAVTNIYIKDATNHDNIFTLYQDQTIGFSPESNSYAVPDGPPPAVINLINALKVDPRWENTCPDTTHDFERTPTDSARDCIQCRTCGYSVEQLGYLGHNVPEP